MDFFLCRIQKKRSENFLERRKKGNETKRKPGRAGCFYNYLIFNVLNFLKYLFKKKELHHGSSFFIYFMLQKRGKNFGYFFTPFIVNPLFC
jgi:hypothetical protein